MAFAAVLSLFPARPVGCVLILLLPFSVFAQPAADRGLQRLHLQERIAQQGPQRVIVELKVDSGPAPRAQRIESARHRLEGRMRAQSLRQFFGT